MTRRWTVRGWLSWPGRVWFLLFLLLLQTAAAEPDARLVQAQGQLRYFPSGYPADRQEGIPITTNQMDLFLNDRLETLENASATLWFKDQHPIRMKELSSIQILAPVSTTDTVVNLLRGALYYFSRGRPKDVKIRTRNGIGAPLGTEFLIEVDGDRTTLTLFDGEADLENEWGKVRLTSGEVGVANRGQPPTSSPIKAQNIVQWWLYFPAVLDLAEVELAPEERPAWSQSLAAYSRGNLRLALENSPGYPEIPLPKSEAVRTYLAALYLGAGQLEKAERMLNPGGSNSPPVKALEWIIAAVRRQTDRVAGAGSSSSEWLGLSYYFQSRHQLKEAIHAAKQSVELSPGFGFGWARLGELQFGMGAIAEARISLTRSLTLAPENAQAHALLGFVRAGENCWLEAMSAFEQAIRLDPALGNGWLGRGLIRIRLGDSKKGRDDLQMAALLEPERSAFRSYLGKALADAGEGASAELEFLRAKTLDPMDPTAWLYAALLKLEQNRINEAISEIEESVARNQNRAVYRSGFLLDQDRAVRSANLAAIYRENGLERVSVGEAADAVRSDYLNHSAHLFLANSYNALRDPDLVQLRYETATFSEYLLANLLAPVGAGSLSPFVSQQEYSRLFDVDRIGLSSQTAYRSNGEWVQQASLYGWAGNTGHAIDVYEHTRNGRVLNNDLEQRALSLQIKQQFGLKYSMLLHAVFSDSNGGDTRTLFDASSTDPNVRVRSQQSPNLFAGFHHEWSPENHTLILASRLVDRFELKDQDLRIRGVLRDSSGGVVDTVQGILRGFGFPEPSIGDRFDRLSYRSDFEAYSVEAQQIGRFGEHTVVLGSRFQTGQVDAESRVDRSSGQFPPYSGSGDFQSSQLFTSGFDRVNGYAYDQWQALDSLWLTAGIAYDALRYPMNVELPPIASGSASREAVSPKAGFAWRFTQDSMFRGAYSRSLGGLFSDGSARLEPSQAAGFNQSYRSLIAESIEGTIAGSAFETLNVAIEQKFKFRTYLVLEWELLSSDARREMGVFDFDPSGLVDAQASQLEQRLNYEERSIHASINQLLGDEWSLGARYTWNSASLKSELPRVSELLFPVDRQDATLHEVKLFAIHNHRSGIFGVAETVWRRQNNNATAMEMPGDDFWHFNVSAGYRFPRRRAEMVLSVLNLTDRDYRLNPLNYFQSSPHGRTLQFTLKLNF